MYKVIESEKVGTPAEEFPLFASTSLEETRAYVSDNAMNYHYGLSIINENGEEVE